MTIGPSVNRPAGGPAPASSAAPAEATQNTSETSGAQAAEAPSRPAQILDAFKSAGDGLFQTLSSAVGQAAGAVAGKAKEVSAEVQSRLSGWDPGLAVNTLKAGDTAGVSTPYNLADPAQRQKLIEGSPQVNELSNKAGNPQDICAGAAMTNAVLMDCKTPADAKRNADAIRSAMEKYQVTPRDPATKEKVMKALDHMADGKMSPADAQLVQQGLYSLGQGLQGAAAGGGLSAGAMTAAVTVLKAEGAFQSSSPTFHLSRVNDNPPTDHWTVSSDGQHANSLPKTGDKGPGQLTQGTPAGLTLDANNPKSQGEVRIDASSPPKVVGTWRQPGVTGPGEANTVSLEPEKFKAKDTESAFYMQPQIQSAVSRFQKIRLGASS